MQVSIDFSTQISINSLASGVSPPHPGTASKWIFQNFLNSCPNFRQKCDKTFKKIWKNREISLKIWKNCKFFIDFLENFWKPLRPPGGSARGTPTWRPPFQAPLGGPRFPQEKYFRGRYALYHQFMQDFSVESSPEKPFGCQILEGRHESLRVGKTPTTGPIISDGSRNFGHFSPLFSNFHIISLSFARRTSGTHPVDVYKYFSDFAN